MKGYYERTKKKKPVDRGGRSHIWPVDGVGQGELKVVPLLFQ
jgi:hypothetical protein